MPGNMLKKPVWRLIAKLFYYNLNYIILKTLKKKKKLLNY